MADETVLPNATPATEAPSTVPAPAPTPSSAPTSPGVAPTEAAGKEDRRDTIRRVIADKSAAEGDTSIRDRLIAEGKIKPASAAAQAAAAAKARNERGQFTQAPAAAAAAPIVASAVAAPVPAPQRPPLPQWLKKELDPIWQQGDPNLLNAFSKYGEDASKGIDKYKAAAQERDALMAEFRPYEQIMRQENATPATAIRSLLQTSAVLRTGTPQQKAQLVAQTIQQFGVPFAHVAQMFGVQLNDAQGNPVQIPQQDPQIAALMQEVNSLKGSMQSREQAAQQAENARFAAIVTQTFADAQKFPHYETLKPQIARILNAGLVENAEAMSEHEILQAAYTQALRLSPTLFEQHLAQERERATQAERDKANQVAQTSRAAAVQVRGAPGSTSLPAIDPKDRRSAIRAAIAVHSR